MLDRERPPGDRCHLTIEPRSSVPVFSKGSPTPPDEVLIMTAEDDLADTLVPRLMAADADLDNVEFITGRKSKDASTMLSLPEDVQRLKNKILETDAGLLLIDPFNRFSEWQDGFI